MVYIQYAAHCTRQSPSHLAYKEHPLITQQLRKVGNSYVVTVPKDEVERRGWQEGQLLALQLTQLEVRPVLRPELQNIVDQLLDEHEDALRYLAER